MNADQAIASINEAKAEIDAMLDSIPAIPKQEQSHAAILRRLQAEKAIRTRRPLSSLSYGPKAV